MKTITTDICIIGGGSAGLSIAAVTAQMGLKVVLIEKDKMGGDCLNYGCVPSKSLLAAAKVANTMRKADQFGIQPVEPQVDYAKVRDHVKTVIANIAPHDSVERFEGLGVNVIKGAGQFVSRNTFEVGDNRIIAKHFVIATGSHPFLPAVPGLDSVDYLTNETLFDLAEQPTRLLIIGGGPIGSEMAQAHLLLGTKVSLFDAGSMMPKDDADCVDVVRKALLKEGLDLHEQINILEVVNTADGITIYYEQDGKKQSQTGSHLLVATGRRPNVDGLALEKAGVEYSEQGITTDARLRSTNKRIYAGGDVAGSFQFTHAAGYHAGIIIRNIVFHLPAKVNYRALPWVTYTEPELAHVGFNEKMAKQQGQSYRVVTFGFSDIDRSQAEHATDGFIKVLVDKKGYVMGATIVGEQAGELLQPWVLAMNNHLKMKHMASQIAPYPTRSDINKRVAGEYFASALYSKRMQMIVKWLAKF